MAYLSRPHVDLASAILRLGPAAIFTAGGYTFQADAAYNFLIIVTCLVILVPGSGVASVDISFSAENDVSQAPPPSVGQPHPVPVIGQSNRLTAGSVPDLFAETH